MRAELNHTIVSARDKQASAAFLARVLGVSVGDQWGPFVPVTVGPVSFDYMDNPGAIAPQHYAFLVDDELFDAACGWFESEGIQIWADPHQQQPGKINHRYGGRGVYFQDPSGHLLELITTPYGTEPQ